MASLLSSPIFLLLLMPIETGSSRVRDIMNFTFLKMYSIFKRNFHMHLHCRTECGSVLCKAEQLVTLTLDVLH